MKRLIISLAAAILAPAAASAQVWTHDYFKGERITGIEASSAFKVRLEKSNETKAVVTLHEDLVEHLRISRDNGGIVSVGLRDMNDRAWKFFNRLREEDKKMEIVLYLPSVSIIRLSGASNLSSSDEFTGENVDILLSGASHIASAFNIASSRVKLQCSGASKATMDITSTRELIVVASGASHVEISARDLGYSKLGASGASHIEITGSGLEGDWTVSGASKITGDGFAAKDLTVHASGASKAIVNASSSLTTRASGASSIRYAGKPASFNDLSNNSVRPL